MKRIAAIVMNWLRVKTTAEKHRQLRLDGLLKSTRPKIPKRPRP
jgi:hypothetical protein